MIDKRMSEKPIYVTQPHMPPLEEFIPYLEKIWETKILTNGGPFHAQLEDALRDYLGVPHVALFSNGTLALMAALRALSVVGEVITTPYSFVATTHSLVWHGNQPTFVDIEPTTLNIDPSKIAAAITPRTRAIMPVHCYGNPCDVERIERIARDHNLHVIYDAAHAFGVECQGGSILNYGDLSVLSFHATKVFNTFEGGAIVCRDERMKERINQLKNFGFVDETTVVLSGINAKMNEVSAAFGLLQLKEMPYVMRRRAEIDEIYRAQLKNVKGISVVAKAQQKVANHAYFPILVGREYPLSRDALYEKLKQQGIYARRYFYPLISQFPMYKDLPSAQPSNLPEATFAANAVLCLPIYPALGTDEQRRVVDLIGEA
jgi:dTDP-4-amino-4,6-dideoxygalactose transaminase